MCVYLSMCVYVCLTVCVCVCVCVCLSVFAIGCEHDAITKHEEEAEVISWFDKRKNVLLNKRLQTKKNS